jgi:hypothetical protein
MAHGKRALALAVAALVMSACGPSDGDGQVAADTLTRRQRDSIISTMPIPGARGVGRALDAQDATRARANALDSFR